MSGRSTPSTSSLPGSPPPAEVGMVGANSVLVAGLNPGEESQTPVDHRSALQVLEQLFAEGKITGRQHAELNEAFSQLATAFKKTQSSEMRHMELAKTLTRELVSTEAELEHAEIDPSADTSEIGQQRQLLIKHKNNQALIEERLHKLDAEIIALTGTRDDLKADFDKIPNPEEVAAKRETMQAENVKVQQEVEQSNAKLANLREELRRLHAAIDATKEEAERAFYLQVEVKDDLVKARSEPASFLRQISGLQKEKRELEQQIDAHDAKHETFIEKRAVLSQQLEKIKKTHDHFQHLLDERQLHYEESQKEFGRIAKELEASKEEEVVLAGDRLQKEMIMQQIEDAKHRVVEDMARLTKDKDVQIKNLKLRQMQIGNIQDVLKQLHPKKVAAEQKLREVQQTAAMNVAAFDRLKMEKQHAEKLHTDQENMTSTQKAMVKQMDHNEIVLLGRITSCREQLRHGNKKLVEVTKHRDDNARELESHANKILNLKSRLISVTAEAEDLQKQAVKALSRVEQLRRLHDVLKAERAKLAQLVTLTERKKVETGDKARLYVGVRDVLKAQNSDRDRLLQQCTIQRSNVTSARDLIKQEVAASRAALRSTLAVCEKQAACVARLTSDLARAEETMKGALIRYDAAVGQCNDVGIALTTANDDAMVLIHKRNLLEKMLLEATVDTNAREEEYRFLKIELAEEQRSLATVKMGLPNKEKLDNELVVAQIELAQAKEDVAELEKQLEDTSNLRINYLSGPEVDISTLVKREQELEQLVEEKERQTMEKKLMFDEVSRMTGTAQDRVDSDSNLALAEAKRINELKGKLEKANRKTMALVAELSVQQSEVAQAQQDIAEKQASLDESRKRLEQGLAPNVEALEEWRRQCRYNEQLKAMHSADGALEPSEFRELQSGVQTTAPNRTNAYLPLVPEVDVPVATAKPYGAFGAFVPSEPGAALRHYRKPTDKPIEI